MGRGGVKKGRGWSFGLDVYLCICTVVRLGMGSGVEYLKVE